MWWAPKALYTARGDAADDTAWCKYLPYASLAKADALPVPTPRLRQRAGHAAHDHYDHDVQSRCLPSSICPGMVVRIRLALELEKESAPRGQEEGCGMWYANGVGDPDGAAHSGENEGYSGGCILEPATA
ncbi:hypothetical protein B0H16DRAFT_1462984 [Mycena metata]|uniref:Uncharacterized protein n=1 Tax=Mycena metata TaxID=1033252 RepID=A0AAD7N5E6_9AGAR|nr:hypothetical protein B0H16DRAFT_1462984 [Mycena metata]